jgi:hypothetical protein
MLLVADLIKIYSEYSTKETLEVLGDLVIGGQVITADK